MVTCRGIPDVADESGDIATSSYDIYSDELGGASGEGGTSLSSPLMMGMWARVQAAAAASGTWGFANPLIYAVEQERHPGRGGISTILRGRYQRRLPGDARLGLRARAGARPT